jgi:hypothetical protein
MGKKRNRQEVLAQNLKVEDHWEELGADDRLIRS